MTGNMSLLETSKLVHISINNQISLYYEEDIVIIISIVNHG